MAVKALRVAQWEDPPVHPVNNAPMMSEAELEELAKDIEKYGLQEPIILWRDNREEANGGEGPFPIYLLDGRNRLAALKHLGVTDPRHYRTGNITVESVRILRAVKPAGGALTGRGAVAGNGWEVDCDPAAFHLSMNVYRRHLSVAQRRWMIKQAIVAEPQASDSAIARKTKADRATVTKVRAEVVDSAETRNSDHLPAERAKQHLRDHPAASLSEIQKQASVSRDTAVRVRKQMVAAGEIASPSAKTSDSKPRAAERKAPPASPPKVPRPRHVAADDPPVPALHLAWAQASARERAAFVTAHSPELRALLGDR